MKQVLGIVIGVVGLTLAALLGLRIWGVAVVGSATVLRSGATLGVLAVVFVSLLVLRATFFKHPAAGYDARTGNRAHPRQSPTPPRTGA